MADDQVELERLRLAHHQCTLGHWKMCVGGVLVGMPFSIRYRSQLHWSIGGISGTLLDYFQSLQDCKSLKDELTAFQKEIDSKKIVDDSPHTMFSFKGPR